MPDRYFQHRRNRAEKRAQIGLVQIVPGIDADTQRLCFRRGPCTGCGRRRIAACKGLGKGSGVEFDTVDAERLGRNQIGRAGIHENRHPHAPVQQLLHIGLQPCAVGTQVETMIGGDLAVAIGNQRGLRRARAFNQRHQSGIIAARRRERIAFDVVFHPVFPAQLCQCIDIARRDVTLIRARMHGDAVGAGFDGGFCGFQHRRLRAAARIAQNRDLVDVDAECGHALLPLLALVSAFRALACSASSRMRRSSSGPMM